MHHKPRNGAGVWNVALAVSLIGLAAFSQEQPRQESTSALAETFHANESSLEDQTDVAVTVYNNNLALVRDRRKIVLAPGRHALEFMDVAQQIKPETVSLQSVSDPGSITILEQNYEYDLISPEKLMEKYVGKTVRLINFSSEIGFEEATAELMSVNGGPVYRVGEEIYLGHPGNVVLPEIPENLIAKPTLVWLLDNQAGDQEVEATYLTHGMSWQADYVLNYDETEGRADLDGWVTLSNQSGATFEKVLLKVVAGDVNIVQDQLAPGVKRRMIAAEAAAPMVEETFAEYHLYTLPRRTTIKENQSKQVNLLNASGLRIGKRYEYRGDQSFYFQRIAEMPERKVSAFLEFQNEEANNLGMPLPAGTIRVYQKDQSGTPQFAGEDRIDHTPKDEEVKLRLGNAFDVVGERKQTEFTRLGDRHTESAYEIKIRNHKTIPVRVDVIEHMPGDWTVIRSSEDYEIRDAHTAVFDLRIGADEEAVLTYRVRVRF